MASIIRRAGAHILKMLQTVDPAAVANQVQVYSKLVGGVAQLYARASDGTIYQLTPGPATAWAAGTYETGAVVSRGPYLWRANTQTTEDPMVVEGNLGLGADWILQATGGAGAVQGSNQILFINNVAGQAATAYRQNVHSGFLGKMLIADLQISGAADWIHFGIFNSASVMTATNINFAGSTFYGLNINIFNGRIENWIDGVQAGALPAYTNANATNAGAAFARWYISMIQNGANWDLTLYRDNRTAGATTVTGQDIDQVDDLVAIVQFSNVARPAYNDWRFVIGARTGGSAGIFRCRAAYVRPLNTGAWTALARLPTQLSV